MIAATRARFDRFNLLRGKPFSSGQFWDVVVLTAADESQKQAYEAQLNAKLLRKLLPLSADYLVVVDPPGFKIGNGGSTLVALETLHEKYGSSYLDKKILIIHAGGFSQRLPNASVMGKLFVAMPVNKTDYQMLEVKLASYIDFPAKITGGGVFVCCADTLEAYSDNDIPWQFSTSGFTALAHPSSLIIGRTHGVFVLERIHDDEDCEPLIRRCRKFLHKPSIEKMKSTAGCVKQVKIDRGTEEIVHTDSAFFISPDVCAKLLDFYKQNKPLTCEIDAYGDFLQSLGTEADDSYVTKTDHVVSTTDTLSKMRHLVFDLLRCADLDVVALVPSSKDNQTVQSVNSHFYHFGTTKEYLELLTEDRQLEAILQMEMLSSCLCAPGSFTAIATKQILNHPEATPEMNGHKTVLPRIMTSVICNGVTVGERSVLEYCRLQEYVVIGKNCIISNCSVPPYTKIPDNTFLHSVALNASKLGSDYVVGYLTVAFSVHDDLKRTAMKSKAGFQLNYFGSSLQEKASIDLEETFAGYENNDTVSLWHAKIFPLCRTMEESCLMTCQLLIGGMSARDDKPPYAPKNGASPRLSMKDILKLKNVNAMLEYREQLAKETNRPQDE